ncbi:hypothetical protein I6E84_07390 [Psychrobacter sp. SCQQ22]|uniref:hypothetical protein n=1 Tax=unclassified Psychrobacter TaxID=196806 RepID=UPI0018CD5182|nr:hypothetical protein [Psychrobacter sp. SCQQ22]MBH0086039.1 hypothetical protein [Psychrobacter sp. SCQQ22]
MSSDYVNEGNLSLILRIAANNCNFLTFSAWESKTIADLLYRSLIVDVFKYDGVRYLNLDHISSHYQWLFYYHQLANACRIIQTMPETIDLSTLEYFSSQGWMKNVQTAQLKKDARFVLKELAKLATFPKLEDEWLKLFEAIKDQNIRIETQNAMNQTSIGLNMKNRSLFYTDAETANWYDILSVTLYTESISPDIVKSISKLRIQESSSFADYKPTLVISSFDKYDL